MTIFANMGFGRRTLAAFAACGLIIAASQGVRAENATSDYVAPLDMTSTYAGAFEDPDFLSEAMYARAMAAPETTGVSSVPSASGREDATWSQQAKAIVIFRNDEFAE